MKRDTKFKPGVSGNETARWGPGQSGNPAGKSKGRARFEEAFNEALITQGSAEEAAQLLWQAARLISSAVRRRTGEYPPARLLLPGGLEPRSPPKR